MSVATEIVLFAAFGCACRTDRAVKLGEIPYSEFPTISFSKQESIEMPFRKCVHCGVTGPTLTMSGYVADDKGEPILPPGMKEHLKADLDRTIDDF